jgi:hypothetical protein
MFKLKLIRFLGRIEYGFYIFLRKKTQQAKLEGKHALAFQLERHARQEEGHAKMLWGLIDGKNRPRQNSDTTILVFDTQYFIVQPVRRFSSDDKQLQQLDGISHRYRVAQSLFGGKSASDYGWTDALAFMAAGELISGYLYKSIASIFPDSPEKAIFRKIADDEIGHSDYLLDALILEIGSTRAYCYFFRWLLNLVIASFYIVFDMKELYEEDLCKKHSKNVKEL